jgi:hypothetical protein
MTVMDWGAMLQPALGGPVQRIERIGSRYSIAFNVPPMHVESEGREAIALLQMALQQGALVAVPQVEFTPGMPGPGVKAAAGSAGKSLRITGATPGYTVRQGQFLNVSAGGRRYLYCAAAGVRLNAQGGGLIPLTMMLRTRLAGGEAVELALPVIEGWLDGELGWTLEMSRTVGLSFTCKERA